MVVVRVVGGQPCDVPNTDQCETAEVMFLLYPNKGG